MKKLLLLLIIPFLSFGQCEDESACNYGMTAEDFIDGAFTGECEYVGDYCFVQEVFFPESPWGPNWCGGSLGKFSAWDENCECVVLEYDGCSPSDPGIWNENGCPFFSSNPNYHPPILPIPLPDSILCNFIGVPSSFELICLEPGDSCLFGNFRNPALLSASAGTHYPTPDTILHSDTSTVALYPIDILESNFTNFPYDWLVVNYFNSVINENCECECVSGDYLYVPENAYWEMFSNNIPLQQVYYDCNPLNTNLEEILYQKALITTIDILGRETTNKGFQLHIYDDGTVEKKYVIK